MKKNVSVLSGEDHNEQLAFAPSSLILTNNFLPLNEALAFKEYHLAKFIEKLIDYLIPIIITLFITLFAYGTLVVKTSNLAVENKLMIQKIEKNISDLKVDLDKYVAVSNKLVGVDNTQLILEQEQLKLQVSENKNLLQDINGLVANDPKKIIALERVNDKLTALNSDITQIKSNVAKNDDRIYSGLSYWLTILLFVLTIALSITVKVLLSKRNET